MKVAPHLVPRAQVQAAGRQAHHSLWHHHARSRDAAHQLQPTGGLCTLQGGALRYILINSG